MMLAPTQLFTYPLCSCALYLAISTTVECALQIHLFLTNKANFRKSQMNVNDLLTMNYGKMDTWSIGKNKANSNPIQTQYKAKTNPIQSQTNPIYPVVAYGEAGTNPILHSPRPVPSRKSVASWLRIFYAVAGFC